MWFFQLEPNGEWRRRRRRRSRLIFFLCLFWSHFQKVERKKSWGYNVTIIDNFPLFFSCGMIRRQEIGGKLELIRERQKEEEGGGIRLTMRRPRRVSLVYGHKCNWANGVTWLLSPLYFRLADIESSRLWTVILYGARSCNFGRFENKTHTK